MTDLTSKRCVPCEGGVDPLTRDRAEELMGELHDDWALNDDATEIHRDYKFKGFYRTMAFVNAVAWIANNEGHHPDMEVGYNHGLVRFTTHAVDGLTDNDFICAAKVDALLSE